MAGFTSADLLGLAPVLPVVVLSDPAHAVPLGRALLAGGCPAIEITLRTPGALEAIKRLAESPLDVLVGAGTVTTPSSVRSAVDAGAQFLVSPGATDQLLDAMDESGVPYLPGVATVAETMRVLDRGHREMKLFPAEACGGRAFLSSIAAVLPAAEFCPTGGITAKTAPLYRALDNVRCVGGTWLAPKDAIAAQNWPPIQELAIEAQQEA
ncbi:MAG TPA: bifunctional 4-hydroxy-2-oxoglutarate aldolase/2-dehydro-3-deoxy-phosphogluconate aldolase [Trebonia sp.]|jgi:2-dehydro-3-deoxyphosphogluconate aldolase/(4S)-4-hydroxy-2-oxoglutarate aldolase